MTLYLESPVYEHRFLNLEEEFSELIRSKDLQRKVDAGDDQITSLVACIEEAIAEAYRIDSGSQESHLFLQRILYQINRMKLFWYDDLKNYENEDSPFLFSIRSRIESAWQGWELQQLDMEGIANEDVVAELEARVEKDLHPRLSETGRYIQNDITEAGYRRLMAILSVNGLVESSQLSRVLGGVGNEVQSMLTRIFLEEYGGGKLARKHSTFFEAMLNYFDMNAKPEAYLDLVPWSVLADINHSFTLCERKKYFLRYAGGLLFTEVTTPAVFDSYKIAGERLGFDETAVGYWDLHMKEDERHGQWMLTDVALPLAERYPDCANDIVLGYEQQRFLNIRSGQEMLQSILSAEEEA
ncbi:MAG: hypothetical protein COV66_15425 [Nitrospinae bacterium CG11_big_fil_rev_8_21_14_0_20_45_15]|nr:MAG: hypothetical protein COV66_15425 [Nitrospinae bacterium CG11_big_fil_rev_8_21_14_0_20_45_15]